MQTQMTPIIAVDQAIIYFAGHNFLIVRLPDDRVAVVFSHLCEALDLDRWSQTRRIQSQSSLAKHLLLVRIKTPGEPQVVNALVTSVLSLWLGGFRLGRHSPEKRALIELLQADAADEFQSHFYKVDAQARPQPKTAAPPRPEPEPTLPPPPPSSPEVVPLSVTDLLREVIRYLEQKDRNLEAQVTRLDHDYHALLAWQTEVQRRLSLNEEQVAGLWSVIASSSRAGAPSDLLTVDHHRTLGFLLQLASRLTGRSVRHWSGNCWRRWGLRRGSRRKKASGIVWWRGFGR